MPYKIYLIRVAEGRALPAEALFQRAVYQETIVFNSPKEVSEYVKKQHKRGLQYFGKHSVEDGKEPTIFFLMKEKNITQTDRLYQS